MYYLYRTRVTFYKLNYCEVQCEKTAIVVLCHPT